MIYIGDIYRANPAWFYFSTCVCHLKTNRPDSLIYLTKRPSADPDGTGGGRVGRFLRQFFNQRVSLLPLSDQETSHAITSGGQAAVRSGHNAEVTRLITHVRKSLCRTATQPDSWL